MTSPLMESPPGPEVVIDGVKYLYFGGTSYLGLHGNPSVIAAGCDALKKYGVHTATTRAGFGTSPLLLKVEELAARFFGTEDAFYFSSGYVANHIVLPAITSEASALFLDETAHFCVVEAARLAGKPVHRFRHRDPADLASQLRQHLPKYGSPIVVADGVTPATGAIAPVRDYLKVLKDFAPAGLHVDDAHGFGVLGEDGRGIFEEVGLWQHVNGGSPIDGVSLSVCGTLAKALGGFGGIVPGTRDFVAKARASSHYFDGASAPASSVAGCSAAALEICIAQPELRRQLRANIRWVRDGLREMGLEVTADSTANIGFTTGKAEQMRRLHEALKAIGILVPYMPAYSGVGPDGLLRLAVCAGHTNEMLDRLLAALKTHVTL